MKQMGIVHNSDEILRFPFNLLSSALKKWDWKKATDSMHSLHVMWSVLDVCSTWIHTHHLHIEYLKTATEFVFTWRLNCILSSVFISSILCPLVILIFKGIAVPLKSCSYKMLLFLWENTHWVYLCLYICVFLVISCKVA